MTGALVAPGLSALARQMVAEIGEEDQERAEHRLLVAIRTEPPLLPLRQYVAGINWRPLINLFRRRPAWQPGPVASAIATAFALAALIGFGLLGYAVSVCVVYSLFGPVPAVVAAWFAAGVAVCLLVQHAVSCVSCIRGGGRRAR